MELLFEERASKGIVKEFFTFYKDKSKRYKDALVDYKTLLDMVMNDTVLFSALKLTVNLATQNGYDFHGDNKRQIKEARKFFSDTLDFDQVIKNILWQLLIFGDSYLEIRWNESKTAVKEIHPLESSQMRVNFTESGEIIGYTQKIDGKDEENWPRFAIDEIIYFRRHWIGSQVYSYAPFKSLARSYSTKIFSNDYLQAIFRNMPPKIIYHLSRASKEQKEMFFQNLIKAKTNPMMDIIAQTNEGSFDARLLQVSFDNGLMEVLKHLQKEVLMITMVPPHWIGLLDGANRGIGENVVIPFETEIKELQQKVASRINKELLPKLGLAKIKFQWNPISLSDEEKIIKNAGQLKAMSLDSESIIQYMRDKGLNLHENAKIEEILPIHAGSPQIQQDSAPSRARKGKGDLMGNELDSKGVSAAGKEKLEARK